MINEAIADMADPRIVGEVNRLRKKLEAKDALDKMQREARHRVDEISRELLIVEHDLVETMVRVERANLRTLIKDQLTRSFPAPPVTHISPELTPLEPRRQGPVELPVLADSGARPVRCFRCRKRGHKVVECPQKKLKPCSLCGDFKHKKAGCPYGRPPKVEVEVTTEVTKEVQELGKMTLLDRIALLDKPDWYPSHCSKCGKQEPKHTELECPHYEYCNWCMTSGSFGYIGRHQCSKWDTSTDTVGWADQDADLYYTDDANVDF